MHCDFIETTDNGTKLYAVYLTGVAFLGFMTDLEVCELFAGEAANDNEVA